MQYKFIEDLKALLEEHDYDALNELESANITSPHGAAVWLRDKFPDCPVGTSAFRDGTTIEWLRKYYDK